MSVKMRRHVERQIARKFLMGAFAAGYSVNIDNGGDEFELPEATNSLKVALDTMFAAADDRVYLYRDGKHCGWVYFVYGNDGYDVISDYTTNLEPLMVEVRKLADKYGN